MLPAYTMIIHALRKRPRVMIDSYHDLLAWHHDHRDHHPLSVLHRRRSAGETSRARRRLRNAQGLALVPELARDVRTPTDPGRAPRARSATHIRPSAPHPRPLAQPLAGWAAPVHLEPWP